MVRTWEAAHVVGGRRLPAGERQAEKRSPETDELLGTFPLAGTDVVTAAVDAARAAFPAWAAQTVESRGRLVRAVTRALEDNADELVELVHLETGKPRKDARGELSAAIEMGYFIAGEGRRFYGRTTTSGVPNKQVSIVRSPIGVAALIVASNTPLPNYAWKVFPAILCGDTCVLKPSEDTPFSATRFVELVHEAGVPDGVVNLVHGLGPETGRDLVDADVDLLSFTGSSVTGRAIAASTAPRLVKTCLELGGKNPLVVCDDADLDGAAAAAVASAFSNAGQRCAAGSRIVVMDAVHDAFLERLLDRTRALRLGSDDGADVGPVINERQLDQMVATVEAARSRGARVLLGGSRHGATGCFMEPTVVADVAMDDPLARKEVFGPVVTVHRAADFDTALSLAADTDYGLTAAVWTTSVHRAQEFVRRIQAGMVVVNGPTFGSEPHMPFGGFNGSGNGFREAGTEVLDVYSDWKTVAVLHDPEAAR